MGDYMMRICFAIIVFIFSGLTVYAAPSEALDLCCTETAHEFYISPEAPSCCEAATSVGCCSPMIIPESTPVNDVTDAVFCMEYKTFIPTTPKNSIFKPPKV